MDGMTIADFRLPIATIAEFRLPIETIADFRLSIADFKSFNHLHLNQNSSSKIT
jgi:hypothetical protein